MSQDTAPPPAASTPAVSAPEAQPAAPAAPPPAATAPTSPSDPTKTAIAAAGIRSTLRDGIRSRVEQMAGAAPPAVLTPPATGAPVSAPPSAPPETAAAAPSVKQEQKAAPATQATAEAAAPPASAGKETAPPAQPSASAAPPTAPPEQAPHEPAEAPAPPAQAAAQQPAAKRADLPAEYATAEYQQRFGADPGLRTELTRIWNNTSLSEVARAKQMDRRVATSDQRHSEVQQTQQRAAQLRRDGDLQGWAAEVERQEAIQQAERQWAQGVTQILARTLGVEPDDEGFLSAGSVAPGESEELRASRFAEWAIRHSAVGQQALADARSAAQIDYEAQIATLTTEHDAALKALERDWTQKVDAARAEGLAQGRGANGFPPRANAAGTLSDAAPPPPLPGGLRDIRSDLRAGLSLRREAARAAAPS